VALLVFAIELWWMNEELLELMGSTVDQKMVAVYGALCTIPPLNSIQLSEYNK
jgi:hypothetical protein